jgi:hypothetical protein
MNSLWQVARTYLWRPRFWVLGALYLAIMGLAFWSPETPAKAQIGISLTLSSVIVCFTALQLRRTFGNEVVQLTPRYAAPHLAIGLTASALLWLIVPAILVLIGKWPSTALAAHAVAGIMAGAVAFWPRALIVLVALPFLLSWASDLNPRRPFFSRLVDGGEPFAAAMLFAVALVANAVAVLALVRLPRRGISTNDELAIDAPVNLQANNPVVAWMLSARDRAAERLQQARVFCGVRRWRVPVAIPAFQFCLPVVAVLAMAAVGGAFGAAADWTVLATTISVALMVVLPYAPWHQRRRAFQQEFMRPVARGAFFRQMALALGWDVLAWLCLATLLMSVVTAMLASFRSNNDGRVWYEILTTIALFYSILWSISLFLYGLALATIRFRLWLLIIAIGGLVWFIGLFFLTVRIALYFSIRHDLVPIVAFVVISTAIGLLLVVLTHRRWVAADLQ